MPAFSFSQALTANQVGYNPLTGWQYEYAPFRCYVRLMVRTTGAAGKDLISVFSGSQNIVARSPIQAGGTAGVTPSPLNTPQIDWIASPGDRIIIQIDETAAATPTVDGIIYIDPA